MLREMTNVSTVDDVFTHLQRMVVWEVGPGDSLIPQICFLSKNIGMIRAFSNEACKMRVTCCGYFFCYFF